MSFNLDSLKTNKVAEKDGIWVDYHDGSRLKIARFGNPAYKAFLSMKYKQNRLAIDRGDKRADALAEKIQLEAVATHILVGWEGIESGGKNQAYNAEFSIKALGEFGDFRADVESYANDTALYRDAAVEEDKADLKK